MRLEYEWKLPEINKRPLSIYALLVEESGDLLVGCGMWDRGKQEHSLEIKNATPGVVCRVDRATGVITGQTEALSNIVYPLIRSPWGGMFVGCRTGAAYFMDDKLRTKRIGDFGGGVYGVAFSGSLRQLLLGGRDGKLFALNSEGETVAAWPTPANRLWNLCVDAHDRFVWGSSYDGTLYKLDAKRGTIVFSSFMGPGGITLVNWLRNGLLAVGSFKKHVFLLNAQGALQGFISTRAAVCFVDDLPDQRALIVADYEGRITIFDYSGWAIDEFVDDVGKNNPIWNIQKTGPNSFVAAWANGTVRSFVF